MMKKTFYALAVITLLAIFPLSIQAQEDMGKIFWVQTQTLALPEDGTTEEFDSLANLLHKNVTMKDSKMISQRILRHYWGDDSRKIVIIREYNTMADLLDEATGESLFKAAWKTEAEREAFDKAFNKYFDSKHSDEIFTEMTSLRKN